MSHCYESSVSQVNNTAIHEQNPDDSIMNQPVNPNQSHFIKISKKSKERKGNVKVQQNTVQLADNISKKKSKDINQSLKIAIPSSLSGNSRVISDDRHIKGSKEEPKFLRKSLDRSHMRTESRGGGKKIEESNSVSSL